MSLCWIDAAAYVEKATWPEMCLLVPDVATREEFEHALRMAFADDSPAPNNSGNNNNNKLSPAIKAKLCRAFAAVSSLRESVPRIAPRVFEGLQSELDALLQNDAKTRKKPEFHRGLTVGGVRPPPIVLGLHCWMRVAGSMQEDQLYNRALQSKSSALSAPKNELEHDDDEDDDEDDEDDDHNSGGVSFQRQQKQRVVLTPQQRRLKQLLPSGAPKTVLQARLLLSRIVPLTFLPPFLFASSTNTIAGLLGTVSSVAADATSGVLATDPMSRCALICVAGPPDMVEATLLTELLTADVVGEKGFFRTPVACPAASDQPSKNQDEIFTLAHWFNTSDLAAPFTQAQIHHTYLVYALRRAISRSASCSVATTTTASSRKNVSSGINYRHHDNSDSRASSSSATTADANRHHRQLYHWASLFDSVQKQQQQQAFPPLSEAAAQRLRCYCDCLLRGVESYASNVLGRVATVTQSAQWVSSPTKGIGLRYWDALLREAVILCEAAAPSSDGGGSGYGAPITPECEPLSAALWMILGQIQQGLRAALSLREYDPMLDIRSDAEGAAANAVAVSTATQVNVQYQQQPAAAAPRPYLCHPEQLFVVCRAAIRCDPSMMMMTMMGSPDGGGAASQPQRAERQQRARAFLRDTCTEELLVSLALDPSAVPSTMTAAIRFAVEFGVAPITDHVPHFLHALFSYAALSPLVGGNVLAGHMSSIYSALSATGRVELLLRILFLPLTCAALELQVALFDAPDTEDVRADAGYCLFSLWRAIAPITAISREQAATLPLTDIFAAAFALAFDANSEFRLMWECCMLDDLQMMGERERVAAVAVKDSLIDAFFDCVAMDPGPPPAEGILHAATFMFRFGCFPRMHCAAVLKRLVLHVRVLMGGFSSLDPACHDTVTANNNNRNVVGAGGGNQLSRPDSSAETQQQQHQQQQQQKTTHLSSSNNIVTRGDAMATTLLQFLCGFGASKVGVLHDDFDRYSDAFFDAVANVLVIVGKFASSSGETSATRVFQSLHDLAWDCLAAFTNTTVAATAVTTSLSLSSAAQADAFLQGGVGTRASMLSSGQSTSGSSALNDSLTLSGSTKRGGSLPNERDNSNSSANNNNNGNKNNQNNNTSAGAKLSSGPTAGKRDGTSSSSSSGGAAVVQVSAASLESAMSNNSGAVQLAMQPTLGFVGLRVVGLKALPSTHERMLRRLEAIAIALTNVTVRHPSLRERAVYWLRNAWKKTERWLQQQQDFQQHLVQQQLESGVSGSNIVVNTARLQQMRERCEQLCITCSSCSNLLLNHTDVLIATNS